MANDDSFKQNSICHGEYVALSQCSWWAVGAAPVLPVLLLANLLSELMVAAIPSIPSINIQ
jgi:hypothetical protein